MKRRAATVDHLKKQAASNCGSERSHVPALVGEYPAAARRSVIDFGEFRVELREGSGKPWVPVEQMPGYLLGRRPRNGQLAMREIRMVRKEERR